KAAENAILARCSMCHRHEPVWPGVHAPPKGVVLDDADNIRRHARLIELNAVRSNAMPPGNITAMTAQERQLIAAGSRPARPTHNALPPSGLARRPHSGPPASISHECKRAHRVLPLPPLGSVPEEDQVRGIRRRKWQPERGSHSSSGSPLRWW